MQIQNNKQMKEKSPETDTYICGHLIYDKGDTGK